MVSLTKYLTTTTAQRVITEVRDRLGAQGVFSHNQIVQYRALRDAAATAEGDSYVIALQAAYRRLLAGDQPSPSSWDSPEICDVDTPDAWLAWMGAREQYLQLQAREAYENTSGDRQERWDSAMQSALEAADAHTVNEAVRTLAERARRLPAESRQVVENLLVLFAVRQCLDHGGALLHDGPLPKLRKSLTEMREELLERLAGHLPALVQAFELPPDLVRSAFGTGADTYVTQYAAALNNS